MIGSITSVPISMKIWVGGEEAACQIVTDGGTMSRPPVDVDPYKIHEMAYGLIRVLDAQGNAIGPWAPSIDHDRLRAGLRAMLKTRAYDARMMTFMTMWSREKGMSDAEAGS